MLEKGRPNGALKQVTLRIHRLKINEGIQIGLYLLKNGLDDQFRTAGSLGGQPFMHQGIVCHGYWVAD